jgi:hypothetical protein
MLNTAKVSYSYSEIKTEAASNPAVSVEEVVAGKITSVKINTGSKTIDCFTFKKY